MLDKKLCKDNESNQDSKDTVKQSRVKRNIRTIEEDGTIRVSQGLGRNMEVEHEYRIEDDINPDDSVAFMKKNAKHGGKNSKRKSSTKVLSK